mgnify:CR=1 FL=1
MNRIAKISGVTLLLGLSVFVGSLLNSSVEGASAVTQPGTADDPVVTKSYVDQQIQKVLQGGTSATPIPTPVVTSPTQSSSNEIVIVDVKPGQTLIASAGAEFIVRAGKAIIYSNDANGVADLTDGKDLTNGQVAPSNHLLSYPREGRGIAVQNGQTLGLTVMVRGGYTLQ